MDPKSTALILAERLDELRTALTTAPKRLRSTRAFSQRLRISRHTPRRHPKPSPSGSATRK